MEDIYIVISLQAHVRSLSHTNTHAHKCNGNRWITFFCCRRTENLLSYCVFYAQTCKCVCEHCLCVFPVCCVSLRQINAKDIRGGSPWIMHPAKYCSSKSERLRDKKWLWRRRRGRATTGRGWPLAVGPREHKRQEKNEKTQVIVSAAFEVLDYNHLIVICCLVVWKEWREKRRKEETSGEKKNGKEKWRKNCKCKRGVKFTKKGINWTGIECGNSENIFNFGRIRWINVEIRRHSNTIDCSQESNSSLMR